MDKVGIWEPIERADWVHQLVAVPKPNGDVRLTSDLSPLNLFIVPVHYPLPTFEDLKLKLAGAKVYSKLDLRKGFFHIQLAESSRPLTATMTPKGLRQYMRLPMGATNSGAIFQKLITQTLSDCPGCTVFQDNILVFGLTQEEHDRNLEKVLA